MSFNNIQILLYHPGHKEGRKKPVGGCWSKYVFKWNFYNSVCQLQLNKRCKHFREIDQNISFFHLSLTKSSIQWNWNNILVKSSVFWGSVQVHKKHFVLRRIVLLAVCQWGLWRVYWILSVVDLRWALREVRRGGARNGLILCKERWGNVRWGSRGANIRDTALSDPCIILQHPGLLQRFIPNKRNTFHGGCK